MSDVQLRALERAGRAGDARAWRRALELGARLAGLVLVGSTPLARFFVTLRCPACGAVRRGVVAMVLRGRVRHICTVPVLPEKVEETPASPEGG
jgi:hypothetical protein